MAHDHAHPPARGAPLVTALVATAGVALLEFVGGLRAHSLALLTDSAHVTMDVLALGVAVFAAIQSRRPATSHRSFGYARFEILAALANGGLLLGVTVVIAVEAFKRFASPALPEGEAMTVYAGIALLVNCVLGVALARSAHGDLNVRAALFHVLSDAAGALAVALGGLAVLATHAAWIDPALSLLVAALIVAGAFKIVREASDVLLESAPAHAQLPAVRGRMAALEGVAGVHDLHVWSIGSGMHVLTAHVLLADKRISEASSILRDLERMLHEEFAIEHVTIQFECESCDADDRIVCVNERSGAGAAGLRSAEARNLRDA